MRCPYCGFSDTQVKDSRPSDDNVSIRRRRVCAGCGSRFTTFERVELCEITIVKNSGDREPFIREKMARSVYTAMRKRPMKTEQIERVVHAIVRKIETSGETEITSKRVGQLVLDALKELDAVAYIRFASVYSDFSSIQDFRDALVILEEVIVEEDDASAGTSP